MFGKREPANDGATHLRIAAVDPRLDEWAAMREVYEAVREFPDSSQRRIFEAVQRRLHDEAVVRNHAAEEDS